MDRGSCFVEHPLHDFEFHLTPQDPHLNQTSWSLALLYSEAGSLYPTQALPLEETPTLRPDS